MYSTCTQYAYALTCVGSEQGVLDGGAVERGMGRSYHNSH